MSSLLDHCRAKLEAAKASNEKAQAAFDALINRRGEIPVEHRASQQLIEAVDRNFPYWREMQLKQDTPLMYEDARLAAQQRFLGYSVADAKAEYERWSALVADIEAREALVLPDLSDAEKLNYLIGRYPSVINDPRGESVMTTTLMGNDMDSILHSDDGRSGWNERPITAEEKIALALFYAGYRVWGVPGQYPTPNETFDFCRRAEPLAQYTEWGSWVRGTYSYRYFLVKTATLEAAERGVDAQSVRDERQARRDAHDAAFERARAERLAEYDARQANEKVELASKRAARDKAEADRQQAIDAALVALGYTRDETPTRMSVKGTWVSPRGDSVDYHKGYFELIALAKKAPVAAGAMVVSYRHGNLSIVEAAHG